MSRWRTDTILYGLLRSLAAIAGGIVLLIFFFVIAESWPAMQRIGPVRFFSDPSWHPSADRFNLAPMLVGTLLVTAGALLIATPLGILSAAFCRYYAPPRLGKIYRRQIELLAGIPSVVYGFWGLVVLVPIIVKLQPPGPSLLAGILVLSIMVLPTVALVADASFANVPQSYLDGAAALGLSRWGTLRGVVIPAARSGLYTGVILQTGRAIGETMAVLMVCGNVVQTPHSLFDPIRTLTANIALEMAYAMGDHRSALFASGLVLLLLVAGLVVLSSWLRLPACHDEALARRRVACQAAAGSRSHGATT